MDAYATQMKALPKLRKFDLKVGDSIRHHGIYYDWTPEGREVKVKTSRVYRVIYISEYVFMVEDWNGIKTSFTKKDYQTGEVEKV